MKKGFDYTGVSAIFIIHDGAGKYLFHKRGEKCRDEQGRWDCGGGGVEFGEKVEDVLRREIKEEFCCDILNSQFMGFRDVHREVNGKPTHWVALDYKVQVDPNAVKNGEPHKIDEIGWFSLDALPEPLHSQVPFFLEKYKQQLK